MHGSEGGGGKPLPPLCPYPGSSSVAYDYLSIPGSGIGRGGSGRGMMRSWVCTP
jgi:hypothetical protein